MKSDKTVLLESYFKGNSMGTHEALASYDTDTDTWTVGLQRFVSSVTDRNQWVSTRNPNSLHVVVLRPLT